MADRNEPPAGEPAAPAATGRHGGSGGLSAAELIARSRAASPEIGQRPSRSGRRAHGAQEAPPAPEAPAPEAPPAAEASPASEASAREAQLVREAQPVQGIPPAQEPHAVSPDGSPGGSGKPGRGGLTLVGSRRSGPTLATPVLDPPTTQAPVEPPGTPPRPATTAGLGVAGSGAPTITVPQTGIPVNAPPPRTSRAGRNLPAAIGVGVGLAALIIGTLAVYRPSFVILLTIAVAIGVYEMVTAIGTTGSQPPLVPLLAGVLVMEAAAWIHGPDGLVGALLLTVLGLTVWRLGDGATDYLRDVAGGYLVALYVPFLAGFATLMAHADDGAARIILFILTVVCSDTGGYAVGVLIGKHPMAPTVSPKKSWEGFGGSLVAGGIAGVLMMEFCFHQQWWQGALFGAAIVVTATLGDLGESMIKRDLGIKDMGRLLPGHGGIMDRLDSLLPCAPVAYLLLAAFLPS